MTQVKNLRKLTIQDAFKKTWRIRNSNFTKYFNGAMKSKASHRILVILSHMGV